ncbi:MAG: nucleotidyltransferase domain-containing protein [Caulobacteraceae bacterium]
MAIDMNRGGPELAQGGAPWPKGARAQIVRAAVGPDDQVEAAFRAWLAQTDIDGPVDGGTFRLLPLVYQRLHGLGVDHPLMGRLKGVYRRAWVDTQVLFGEMTPTLAALEDAGVRTLLIKGAPLAITYYRSHATRPMFDLDIVVRTEDRDLALEILRKQGWNLAPYLPEDLPDQHAFQHTNAAGREVDLHWHFLHETPSAVAADWFWRSARPMTFNGVATSQLRPTAMLLHVILHGVRSNEEPPVRWIVDAGAILREAGHEIDWEDLVGFARSQKLCYRTYLGLSYLAREYGIAVPPTVLRELKSAGISLVERAENYYFLRSPYNIQKRKRYVLLSYWRYLRSERLSTMLKGYWPYISRRLRIRHPFELPVMALASLRRGLERRWPRSAQSGEAGG